MSAPFVRRCQRRAGANVVAGQSYDGSAVEDQAV